MSTLAEKINDIINNYNALKNNGFTWNKIKKEAYHNIDVMNRLSSEQNKFTYKYIDMVYYDLYKSIKPDISSFIPNNYENELVLLNIKTHDHFAHKELRMKLNYIFDNINSDKQTTLTDTKVYKIMPKNDAIEYCKEFVKFVEAARNTPSQEAQLHQISYKLEYNCENVNHIQGLYVKCRKYSWSDVFG